MFQVSIIAAIRTALMAAALLGLVVVGTTVRDAGSPESPSLGFGDDHGTRHSAATVELSHLDDFGTRNQPVPESLTLADDFGTRIDAREPLGPSDDHGTRHRR